MEGKQRKKVILLILGVIIAIVLVVVICVILLLNKDATKSKVMPNTETSIQDTSKETNIIEEENDKISDTEGIKNLIKSSTDSDLNGYNLINFGVCSFSQSDISENIKNTVICNLYVKSDTLISGGYLNENGDNEDIPLFQDEEKEIMTTANCISKDDVISELYIDGWLFSVNSNIFTDTASDYVGMENSDMNKMNFIEARRLYYENLNERKSDSFKYEIIDVSDDVLVTRITSTSDENDVSIYIYKDLGNGCHLEVYRNNFYDISTKTYSKYKSCSAEELISLAQKINNSISIIKSDFVGYSSYWDRRLDK